VPTGAGRLRAVHLARLGIVMKLLYIIPAVIGMLMAIELVDGLHDTAEVLGRRKRRRKLRDLRLGAIELAIGASGVALLGFSLFQML